MASSAATTMAIGTRWSRPRARLDVPAAMTKRISSVAYAVDEMASDEKVASAIDLGSFWCSCSELASGRPTRTRLANVSTSGCPPVPSRGSARRQADRAVEAHGLTVDVAVGHQLDDQRSELV